MTCTIISTGDELLKCKNEHEKLCIGVKTRLRNIIWKLYCKNYNNFYLNCEYGIPLWSAEIICAMKMYNDIKLHIVMPYEEQSIEWHDEYRERYFNVHSKSDDVHMIDTHYYDNCYNDADEYMIDHSKFLLIFGAFDENMHCIKYAKTKKTTCLNIKLL